MQPAGLTFKSNGELMLVHSCPGCGKLSCNRIAGDDNPYALLSLLGSDKQDRESILLTVDDREEVLSAIFGRSHPPDM